MPKDRLADLRGAPSRRNKFAGPEISGYGKASGDSTMDMAGDYRREVNEVEGRRYTNKLAEDANRTLPRLAKRPSGKSSPKR